MLLHPKGPYDGFPTRHEELFKEFFAGINTGTPKGYEDAFCLISVSKRDGNVQDEETHWKQLFGEIHDTFNKNIRPGLAFSTLKAGAR